MRQPELNPRRIYQEILTPESFDDTVRDTLWEIYWEDYADVGFGEAAAGKAYALTRRRDDQPPLDQVNRLHIVHSLSKSDPLDPESIIGGTVLGREFYGDLTPYRSKVETYLGATSYKLTELLKVAKSKRSNRLGAFASALDSVNPEEHRQAFRGIFAIASEVSNASYLDVETFDVDTLRNRTMIQGLHVAAGASIRQKPQIHGTKGPRRVLNSVKLSEVL